jgi:tRNA modification GTPase
MHFLYSDEPIIAASTCTHAHAALAVLRISGFASFDQFRRFFALSAGPIEPRRVYFTKLLNEQQQVLDEVCLTYFEGPRSFNGEHILEISAHGNTLNVERILKLFVEQGACRLAAPGEFTYRALKHKKLNLSQVEGLDLFLNANSGFALDQGLSLLNGNLHELYQDLYTLFLKHKSALELAIDFSEDVGDEAARDLFASSLQELQRHFARLVKRVAPQELNLLAPEIVLAGLPNSGKSSLFNQLLSDERAIVSAVPGTTRDYLSETLVIEGVKYRLIDTAGIRLAQDQIEAEGIRRSRKKIESSFFSILLINPLALDADFAALMQLPFDLRVFTHADVAGFASHRQLLLEQWPELGSIGAVNLLQDIASLESSIKQRVNKKYLGLTAQNPLLLDRHKSLILQASGLLQAYAVLAATEQDVAILSSELNTLGHCISELIGIISPDQILNSIFSNFCIGK